MTVRCPPRNFPNAPYGGGKAFGDGDMTKVKDKREVRNENGAAKGEVTAKHAATVIMMPQRGRHAAGATDVPAPSERRALGKALRDAAPRTAHAGWKAPKDRRDPIDLL